IGDLVDIFKVIIRLNRNLSFFTEGYNYLIQLIPLLIVGPLYIRGEVEFGTVTQGAMAFAHVLGAFSVIVKEFQRSASFSAVVTRLGSAREAIEEGAPVKPSLELTEGDRVAYEGLTLTTPGEGRLLVRGLSVEVPCGRRLFISG